MTTVIELQPDEWAQLQQFTNNEDFAHAATAAIREYIRFAKRQRLIELSDQVEMDDNWRELEDRELNGSQSD
jgi:hypothetical protein